VLGAEIGADSKLSLADSAAATGKPKVVIARDEKVHDEMGSLDEKRVLQLLDRGMMSFHKSANPVDCWKQWVKPGQTVGLKVNTLGGRGLSTHLVLVNAISERLQQAGIKAGSIVVWDRSNRDLEQGGFQISHDPNKLQCYGSDAAWAGYEDTRTTHGVVSVQLSKILTRTCDVVINLPILKDHSMAGVTFAMKNMYGVIKSPNELHGGGCCPSIADLNMIDVIRTKVRHTVGDAFTAVYQGGPGFKPEYAWNPNALIIGEDRVALDVTAWQLIARKRAEKGLPTLEEAGRPPRYIAVAGDEQHRLGMHDPAKFALVEV
jgi:uncharacterized protein (DUF362 family)